MDGRAYAALDAIRREFRDLVGAWVQEHPYLIEAQEESRRRLGYDDYRVETPIVYNGALDDIGPETELRIILVADNPGKKEQLGANRRYLVGQSGKLAQGWMSKELGLDFRREVAILNKTPVHSAKTAELALLAKAAGGKRASLELLLSESQEAMADLAWRLYAALSEPGAQPRPPVLWLSGLGQLRRGGLFRAYRDALARRIASAPGLAPGVWAFNHFSMNQFAIEVKRKAAPGAPLLDELARIGRENARRVLEA